MAGVSFWSEATMRSAHELKKQSRRLRRLDAKVAEVMASMQSGSALHLAFSGGQPTWRLSSGVHVAPDVARLVIGLPNIVGVGDTLPIPGALSQTWRHIGEVATLPRPPAERQTKPTRRSNHVYEKDRC